MAFTYLTLEECRTYLRRTAKIVEEVSIANNTLKITNSGFANGTQVKIASSADDVPAPFDKTKNYFIVASNLELGTFSLSLLPNSSVIEITDEGTGLITISNSEDDNFIEEIENGIAETIRNECTNFDFELKLRTEKHYDSENCLFLKVLPLVSIASITDVDSNDIWSSDDYYFFNNGIVMSKKGNFNNVSVAYTGGYDGLPNDLKLVAKKMFALEFKESVSNLLVKSSEETPNSSISFRNINVIRDEFKEVLQRYKVQGI